MKNLKDGGEWLGAARTWMQSNIPQGDRLCWGSGDLVQVPFCKLEELSLRVAQVAVAEDRACRARRRNRIVCAAIKAADGEILLGVRHYSADMRRQIEQRVDKEKFLGDCVQGFVNQHDEFLDRQQAWIVAEAAGQILRRVGGDTANGGTLYSEHLY